MCLLPNWYSIVCPLLWKNLDGDFFFLQFASAIGCHFLWIVSSCFISKVLIKSSDMCSLTLLIFLFFFLLKKALIEIIRFSIIILYLIIVIIFFMISTIPCVIKNGKRKKSNGSKRSKDGLLDFVNHLSPLRIWLMIVNLVFYTYCICPTKKLGLRQWPVSWHKRSAKERGWFGAENPWHAPLLHL